MSWPTAIPTTWPGCVARPANAASGSPVPDLHAPPLADVLPLLDELHERLHDGGRLLVHCGAGIGRAGTMATLVLVGLGMGEEEALAHVAAHRPMAGPEAGTQRELVSAVARHRGR